ncbi:MAG: lytic transglycosylase domain-containing protein [Thiohalocapsa sp.]|jgi:membrane-bound lytic murein transglycosylase D|uniref:lytic transglycosylase domain-containing protein n=1 Tax=Thiohalocapsa sp. TaxID=2497641 RepID=UPI0025D94A9C|nr:lytic transglycosylase domain-containing protein [Thiohalocapsa sp.]MCG6942418.1 lytic transglycosylase domain-containing protein [Thiohalocapsa sp.]
MIKGMSGVFRQARWTVVPALLLSLVACGGKAPQREDDVSVPYAPSAEFPLPAGLEDNVGFWVNVYTKWGRDKVVIHDDRYLAIVYQVASLPGPIEDVYTPAQKVYVDGLEARWRARLRGLEARLASGTRLSPAEQELKAQFEREGGSGALFGAAERVRSQRGVRERYRDGLARSGRWEPVFREVFRRQGLPEDLALLPHVESSFQAKARSSAGASGMWQFIRATGRNYMTVDASIDERLDPVLAADGAARYLKSAYAKLGSWPLALTSYNHGVGGMLRAKERYGTDMGRIVRDYDGRYFGFASRNFYAQFLAARHVARNAERYFPEGVHYQPPLSDQPVRLTYAVSVDELAQHYRVPRSSLVARNLSWLDPVRRGERPVPAGTTVWLPQGASRLARGQPRPSML